MLHFLCLTTVFGVIYAQSSSTLSGSLVQSSTAAGTTAGAQSSTGSATPGVGSSTAVAQSPVGSNTSGVGQSSTPAAATGTVGGQSSTAAAGSTAQVGSSVAGGQSSTAAAVAATSNVSGQPPATAGPSTTLQGTTWGSVRQCINKAAYGCQKQCSNTPIAHGDSDVLSRQIVSCFGNEKGELYAQISKCTKQHKDQVIRTTTHFEKTQCWQPQDSNDTDAATSDQATPRITPNATTRPLSNQQIAINTMVACYRQCIEQANCRANCSVALSELQASVRTACYQLPQERGAYRKFQQCLNEQTRPKKAPTAKFPQATSAGAPLPTPAPVSA